jgi:hypothetical protein
MLTSTTTYKHPKVLLICPPPLSPEIEKGPVFAAMFKGGLEKSRELPELYEAVAKIGGAEFLNAGSVVSTLSFQIQLCRKVSVTSHHFDTPMAKENPRINISDFYLFPGRPGKTVMAMTVNLNAEDSAPDTFAKKDSTPFDSISIATRVKKSRSRFSAVTHADRDERKPVRSFEVRRATGDTALRGPEGDLIVTGRSDEVVKTRGGSGFRRFGVQLVEGGLSFFILGFVERFRIRHTTRICGGVTDRFRA